MANSNKSFCGIRRVLSLLSVLTIMLLVTGTICISAASKGDIFVDGDIRYSVLTEANDQTNGTVSIIGNADSAYVIDLTSLEIPATATDGDGNVYDVTDVTYKNFPNLTEFIASQDSGALASQDGILFSKDKTTLIKVPTKTLLTEIVVPDETVSIKGNAFQDCEAVQKVTLGDNVISIGDYAFSGCTSLSEIDLGDSVQVLGKYAFNNCSSLTKLEMPDSVLSVGASCFIDCTALREVRLSESLEMIGAYSFRRCTSLESLYITDKTRIVGQFAFYGCESLSSVTGMNGLNILGDHSFAYCSALTSFDIPETVQLLGEYVFSTSTGLKSITIPDSVTEIGIGTFFRCSSLETIEIPEKVTVLGANMFNGCTSLVSVKLPSGLLSLGETAFKNCVSLKAIEDLGKIQRIEYETFIGCKSLESVILPETLVTIGNSAFERCVSLESIVLPNLVKTLGVTIFYGCTKLRDVTLSESMSTIPTATFYGCNNLPGIVITESVRSIGSYAFSYCASLVSATIPEGVVSIDVDAFYSSDDVTIYADPDTTAAYFAAEQKLDYRPIDNSSYVTGISIGSDQLIMEESDILELDVTYEGVGDYEKKISIVTSDRAVAYGKAGKIYAVAPGEAELVVMTGNGVSVGLKVIVTEGPIKAMVTGVKTNFDEITIPRGCMADLEVEIEGTGNFNDAYTISIHEPGTIILKGHQLISSISNSRLCSTYITVIPGGDVTKAKQIKIHITDDPFPIDPIPGKFVMSSGESLDDADFMSNGGYFDVIPKSEDTAEIRYTGYRMFVYKTIVADVALVSTEVSGDIDGSGEVGIEDPLILFRYMASIPNEKSAFTFEMADMNGSGTFEVSDVIDIFRIMAS